LVICIEIVAGADDTGAAAKASRGMTSERESGFEVSESGLHSVEIVAVGVGDRP
jgi:hypothetical protein